MLQQFATVTERYPRPGTSERQEHLDAPALRQKGRLQHPLRKFSVAAAANGTEGSNPACFSGESGIPCEIVHGDRAAGRKKHLWNSAACRAKLWAP
jgi:hypothetical protein